MLPDHPTPLPAEISVTLKTVDPGPAKPDPVKRVAELIGLTALLGGLIVSLGWSYSYEYFRLWQMPLADLDLPFEYFLQYGRLVIGHNLPWIIAAMLLLAVVLWLWQRYVPTGDRHIPLALAVIVLLAWFSCHWLATRSARDDFATLQNAGFAQLAKVGIELTSGDGIDPYLIRQLSPELRCFRVVFIAPEVIWIARTYQNSKYPKLMMLPRDQIRLMLFFDAQDTGNCKPPGSL